MALENNSFIRTFEGMFYQDERDERYYIRNADDNHHRMIVSMIDEVLQSLKNVAIENINQKSDSLKTYVLHFFNRKSVGQILVEYKYSDIGRFIFFRARHYGGDRDSELYDTIREINQKIHHRKSDPQKRKRFSIPDFLMCEAEIKEKK